MQLLRKYHIDFGGGLDHTVDYILQIMEDTRTATLQLLVKIPDVELDWQYAQGWNTIGSLLAHLSALDHYFRIHYVLGRDLTAEECLFLEPALDLGHSLPMLIIGKKLSDYLDDLKHSRFLLMQELKQLDFASLQKRIEGYNEQQGCNLAWVYSTWQRTRYIIEAKSIYCENSTSKIKK